MTPASDLDLLIGEWRGRGVAEFPTIERVEYAEVLRIEWDSGREVFAYEQRADLADGSASHRESGYIRILPGAEVELWNAQNNGRTEVLRGSRTYDDSRRELLLDLRSVEFGNDPRMVESRRRLTVSAERLLYELSMATTTTPEPEPKRHLRCELSRGVPGLAP